MNEKYNGLLRSLVMSAVWLSALLPTVMFAESPLPLNREAYIDSYGYSSTPVVGDVNGDGFPEIVFGSRYTNASGGTGYLQVVQKKADNSIVRLLTKNMGGIPRAPALGDVNNDGIPEIVVFVSKYYGNSGMRVEALHADGSVVWSTPINDYGDYYDYYGDYAISLGDVNGDGYPDVVAISRTKLHVLSGLDGSVIWQKTYTYDAFYGAAAVLDLDHDGNNEVIYVHAYNDTVYVYRSDGTLWWTGKGGDFAVADLERDGAPEVITKSAENIYQFQPSGKLMVYSYSGELKWSMDYPFGISYLSGPAVADLDADGFPEIAVAVSEYAIPGQYMPRKNYIMAIGGSTGTGVEKWRSPLLSVGEFDNPSLTCTDLDGNGAPEVTVISDDTAAIVLDGLTGGVLWSSSFNIDENEHSPVIADVDSDGHAEIVTPGGTGVPYISVLGDDIHFVQTRGTWNQMAYSFTNINNDLSVTNDYTPWRTHNTWRTQLPSFIDIRPKIEVRPGSLNFGNVPLGERSSGVVTVLNTGTGDLAISSISIDGENDGEFTQVNNCSTVAPNASCAVSVTFTPSSLGMKRATLNISSNDHDTPTAPVSLTGTGIDATPPTTTILISGRRGDNNWYVSDVAISLTATDSGSGVREIHYTVDGAETVIAGSSASFTISTDGAHPITYYAKDNAGNSETAHSLTIKIDKTIPTITASVSPAPNANGWHNTDVTVTFTCSDAASGIASCPQPVIVTTEGAGQVITGTAFDNAGLSATESVTLNIDKTPPAVSLTASPGLLWPPNHKMVTVTPTVTVTDDNRRVTVILVSFTSSEPDNGLGDGDTANDIVINSDGTILLRAERSGKGSGRVYTITYQATDAAGNSMTASATVTVPHDMGQ